MLERIRMYILQRFTKQRENASKWYMSIGPRIAKILEKAKTEAAFNMPYWCGEMTYQVIDRHGKEYSVDLAKNSCSCRKQDLSGIPCCHASACIWHKQMEPEQFVCEFYRKEAHSKTYAPQMKPIKKQAEWLVTNHVEIKPPVFKK